MAAAQSRPIFFHHGITSFDPRENAFFEEHYPDSVKWERGIFSFERQSAPYYVSKAKNQKAVVIGGSGLKTQYLLNPAEVQRLNDEGISIIWMALPEIRGTAPFMDHYKTLLHKFLTDKNSPAFILFPGDVTRYAAVHSTSAQIFADLMHDSKSRRALTNNYQGVVYYAPFIDTANASRDQSSRFSRISFNFYASRNLDKKPHDTLGGKIYLCLKASREHFTSLPVKTTADPAPQEPSGILNSWAQKLHDSLDNSTAGQFWRIIKAKAPDISPTYRNILEVQQTGRRLMDKFNATAMNALPSIFLIGDQDPFACHKTTLDMAQKMGASVSAIDSGETNPKLLHKAADRPDKDIKAEVIIARGGGHDPIRNNPALLEIFIERVNQCAAQRDNLRQQIVYMRPDIYAPDAGLEIGPPSYVEILRDRARIAYQSSARSLNTLASFL